MAICKKNFTKRHWVAALSLAMFWPAIGCHPSDIPSLNISRPDAKRLKTASVAGLAPAPEATENPAGSVVKLVRNEAGWQLLRNGEPYYINGAGGEGSFEALSAAGANSGRTWGVDENTRARLDEASKQDLTVACGIWLEHERHGFDYNSYDNVVEQIDLTLKHVRDLKDHPAILCWGIGNEMEGIGDNPSIWSHIEHLAQLVKQEDPHHPVMTVIAEMGGKKIEAIHKLCPSVDIIGINSYGGSASLPERYRQLGGEKPYIVTEFGPVGTWEVPKSSIDAIIEPTSTAKAKMYRAAAEVFAKDTEHCLGSYAFLWGNKQEGTATWFGMLLPDGKRTEAADTMSEIWTGKAPENRCPVIKSIQLEGKSLVDLGETVRVNLEASDPENDQLNVRWVVTGEADSYITGGDKQKSPEELKSAVVASDLSGATIKLPEAGGIYRVYAYVDDGEHGGSATANVPVRVKGPPVPLSEPGQVVKLPLVILDEPGGQMAADGKPYFVPSGFMGSVEALELDEKCTDDPKAGKHCLRVAYNRASDWGGVVWQHPENDWGAKPGGFDLTGATKLTFWARGETGGENVKFGFGVIGTDQPYYDTAKKEVEMTLTDQWKQYSIACGEEDLQRIKTGFFLSLAGQGAPVVFYLDRIVFDGENGVAATVAAPVKAKEPTDLKNDSVQKAELPFVLVDEPDGQLAAEGKPYYVPSGFMGSVEALQLDAKSTDDPKEGKHCLRVEYNQGTDWGGVVWQHPENDWGEKPGGFNLTGAKKLTFWARGKSGGEKVKFGFGVIGKDKPFFDTGKKEVEVTLTNQWKQFTIECGDENLERIKTGFFFSLAGQGEPVVFFLDRVTFE